MAELIISFGFRFGKPREPGALVIDVRECGFGRNPYHDPALRGLRGDDPRVALDVEQTPGFDVTYAALKARVAAYPGDVYLGCTGGHHRSVYLADRLGRELGVPVAHRDYFRDKPHGVAPTLWV